MKTIKLKTRYLDNYLVEIFGSDRVQDPLLLKNISQKTKFNLKKLGNSIQTEYRQVVDHIKELYDGYSEEYIPEGETTPKKRIKEGMTDEYNTKLKELDDVVIEIQTVEFTEKDFTDVITKEIVAGSIYYNILDVLLWEEQID